MEDRENTTLTLAVATLDFFRGLGGVPTRQPIQRHTSVPIASRSFKALHLLSKEPSAQPAPLIRRYPVLFSAGALH